MITDRPVYRPDQAVKYKFWVDYAKYDLPEEASDVRRPVVPGGNP